MTKNEAKRLQHVATSARFKIIERALLEYMSCYATEDPEYKRIERGLKGLYAMEDATKELLRIYGLHYS